MKKNIAAWSFIIVLASCLYLWADLQSHSEGDLDTLILNLDSDADGEVNDESLFQRSVSFRIDNYLMSEDNFGLWNAPPYPVTITHVGIRCHGTCTTPATISFEDGGGNAFTHDTITVQTDDSAAIAYTQVTAGGSLVSGELVRIDNSQGSQVPETDEYIGTFIYTVD